MRFHSQLQTGPAPATQLWIMLPGAYMKPADFIEAGFAQALHKRGLPHDIELLEASIAELADGSALEFLQQFLNARAAGPRRRVSLLGISLGAHLAMACLASRSAPASRVSSACLLSPYMGPRDIAAEVAAAGGLDRWQPGPLADTDTDRTIWRWLQRGPEDGCDIYLGYGSEDRFAKAHALMAPALPPGHVDVQPGGHDWPVWSALWNRHLDQVYARH